MNVGFYDDPWVMGGTVIRDYVLYSTCMHDVHHDRRVVDSCLFLGEAVCWYHSLVHPPYIVVVVFAFLTRETHSTGSAILFPGFFSMQRKGQQGRGGQGSDVRHMVRCLADVWLLFCLWLPVICNTAVISTCRGSIYRVGTALLNNRA